MPAQNKTTFHIHMISDATGETLLANSRAISALYPDIEFVEHIYAMVRNAQQLSSIFEQITSTGGIVLYTVLDTDMVELIEKFCTESKLPYVAVLHSLFEVFKQALGKPLALRASAQHALDEFYLKRIKALDFTMAHDDGNGINSIEEAEVLLLGVSRTSKTPTSIYLGNRGIKTANIPIVKGINLPAKIYNLPNTLIVGLYANLDRISLIRQNRYFGENFTNSQYIDRANIYEELKFAKELFIKNNWPHFDVTNYSIEEVSARIINLLQQFKSQR